MVTRTTGYGPSHVEWQQAMIDGDGSVKGQQPYADMYAAWSGSVEVLLRCRESWATAEVTAELRARTNSKGRLESCCVPELAGELDSGRMFTML